jgi:uncharacterized protein YdaU (DUF1376 family)
MITENGFRLPVNGLGLILGGLGVLSLALGSARAVAPDDRPPRFILAVWGGRELPEHDAPKPVTFPVYFDRWFGGTRHLSLAARGAYFDWLAWCYAQNRPLPLDLRARAQIAACSTEEADLAWREVETKWVHTSAGYVNSSLEAKRSERLDWLASQREKAKRGAAARWKGHRRKWPEKRSAPDAPGMPGGLPGGMPGRMPSIFDLRSSDLDLAKKQDLAKREIQPHSEKDPRASRGTRLNGAIRNPSMLRRLAFEIYDSSLAMSENTARVKEAVGAAKLIVTGAEMHKVMSQAEARAARLRRRRINR